MGAALAESGVSPFDHHFHGSTSLGIFNLGEKKQLPTRICDDYVDYDASIIDCTRKFYLVVQSCKN